MEYFKGGPRITLYSVPLQPSSSMSLLRRSHLQYVRKRSCHCVIACCKRVEKSEVRGLYLPQRFLAELFIFLPKKRVMIITTWRQRASRAGEPGRETVHGWSKPRATATPYPRGNETVGVTGLGLAQGYSEKRKRGSSEGQARLLSFGDTYSALCGFSFPPSL